MHKQPPFNCSLVTKTGNQYVQISCQLPSWWHQITQNIRHNKTELQQNFSISNFGILNFRFYRTMGKWQGYNQRKEMYIAYFEPQIYHRAGHVLTCSDA